MDCYFVAKEANELMDSVQILPVTAMHPVRFRRTIKKGYTPN